MIEVPAPRSEPPSELARIAAAIEIAGRRDNERRHTSTWQIFGGVFAALTLWSVCCVIAVRAYLVEVGNRIEQALNPTPQTPPYPWQSGAAPPRESSASADDIDYDAADYELQMMRSLHPGVREVQAFMEEVNWRHIRGVKIEEDKPNEGWLITVDFSNRGKSNATIYDRITLFDASGLRVGEALFESFLTSLEPGKSLTLDRLVRCKGTPKFWALTSAGTSMPAPQNAP